MSTWCCVICTCSRALDIAATPSRILRSNINGNYIFFHSFILPYPVSHFPVLTPSALILSTPALSKKENWFIREVLSSRNFFKTRPLFHPDNLVITDRLFFFLTSAWAYCPSCKYPSQGKWGWTASPQVLRSDESCTHFVFPDGSWTRHDMLLRRPLRPTVSWITCIRKLYIRSSYTWLQ